MSELDPPTTSRSQPPVGRVVRLRLLAAALALAAGTGALVVAILLVRTALA